jgi:hypothetical protein
MFFFTKRRNCVFVQFEFANFSDKIDVFKRKPPEPMELNTPTSSRTITEVISETDAPEVSEKCPHFPEFALCLSPLDFSLSLYPN